MDRHANCFAPPTAARSLSHIPNASQNKATNPQSLGENARKTPKVTIEDPSDSEEDEASLLETGFKIQQTGLTPKGLSGCSLVPKPRGPGVTTFLF